MASLLTVGDSPLFDPSYQMVGIPDGLGALGGAFDPRTGRYLFDRTFMTVFMNHELGATLGAVRAHGQTGAFVSQWTIHLNSLLVVGGQDLQRGLHVERHELRAHDRHYGTIRTALLSRPACLDRVLQPIHRPRLQRPIFMDGEEVGLEGRALATSSPVHVTVNRTSYHSRPVLLGEQRRPCGRRR